MLKAKIEAVLFLTDKPMKAAVLARTLNEDVQAVRQAVIELIHDFEERKGGLEIADDNGYIIQVKDEYSSLINEFAPLEMPVSLLRTLSAIAIKQPVQQSEIIKIRGAGAYDHVRELIIRELIVKKEADEGRSPMLSTTKKFQEYFRLSGDGKSLRTELNKKGKPIDIIPAAAADGTVPVQLQFEDPSYTKSAQALAQALSDRNDSVDLPVPAEASNVTEASSRNDADHTSAAPERSVSVDNDRFDIDEIVTGKAVPAAVVEGEGTVASERLQRIFEAAVKPQSDKIFDATPDRSTVYQLDDESTESNVSDPTVSSLTPKPETSSS